MAEHSPLGAVARGLAAGAVATAAMTGYQDLVARMHGRESSPKPRAWKDAPAPAQVGKRIVSGVFDKQVTLDRVGLLTNAMHWTYGVGWGAAYGLVQGTIGAPPLRAGAALGASVWGLSYAQLVPMGIYEPPWRYPAKQLGIDLSYHLVYGVAAAAAYEALSR
jgi:hypothetical protein